MTRLLRSLGPILAVVCLFVSVASADPLVQGSTSGTFYLGSNSQGNDVEDLTFNGASFGPTTNSTLNLGTFNLGFNWLGTNDNYNPYTFRLTLNFTIPAGTSGPAITADVDGQVQYGFLGSNNTSADNVDIIWNNPTTTFTYAGGSFQLTLANVTNITVDSSRTLQGTISNATFAATPEPSSVILLGTFLGGATFLLRRRFSRS